MDTDLPVKKDIKEFIEKQKINIKKFVEKNRKGKKKSKLDKRIESDKKKNSSKNWFKKGNNMGVKFGSGQSTKGGGRPRKDSTVLDEMKAAAETYGLAANDIAEMMVALGLDEQIEPRFRFLFMKEANLRIFGQPKSSLEETLKHINNKVDKLYELTLPLLEATAVGDGVALVKELMNQGKLDEVVKKIEG